MCAFCRCDTCPISYEERDWLCDDCDPFEIEYEEEEVEDE